MSEKTESDCEVDSSDDDLKMVESKKIQAMHQDESSGDNDSEKEEIKKPFMPFKTSAQKPKSKKGEIEVDFQYVQPCEAYYHSIKALLNQYIDGEEGEQMDLMGMSDHICERVSIG